MRLAETLNVMDADLDYQNAPDPKIKKPDISSNGGQPVPIPTP